jgi:ubiquinone/menaquinone biosynthesis C-methylase UbiE
MLDKYELAYKKCRKGRPTSYAMQDPDEVFATLALQQGERFLDLGCGIGDYSLHASRLVRSTGLVTAIDHSQELTDNLKETARLQNIGNITVIHSDITGPLPIPDNAVDACLFSTVLHIPDISENADSVVSEIHRVLKTGGRLGIVECSKKTLSVGPPEHMRLDSGEVAEIVSRNGFHVERIIDFGFNYMVYAKSFG